MGNSTNYVIQTTNALTEGSLTEKVNLFKGDIDGANRRNVGPRVTLNFITDPWRKERKYTYYDTVRVGHTNYVARKNVPCGIDITDTEYWCPWMDLEGLYRQIEKELQDMKQEIYNLFDVLKEEVENRLEDFQFTLDTTVENVQNMLELLDQTINNFEERFEEFKTEINTEIKNFEDITNNNITNVQADMSKVENWMQALIDKIYGGGTLNDDGTITWGDSSGKIALGTINISSLDGYIRTHTNTNKTNDLKAQ